MVSTGVPRVGDTTYRANGSRVPASASCIEACPDYQREPGIVHWWLSPRPSAAAGRERSQAGIGRSRAQDKSERKLTVPSNFDRYQRIAWVYDLIDLPFEYGRYRKIRPLLFRGLSGRILEAGVGTGRNFPFYPLGSEVVGIDLSPAMLSRAERRRHSAAAQVELRQMDVTRLDFPDRS